MYGLYVFHNSLYAGLYAGLYSLYGAYSGLDLGCLTPTVSDSGALDLHFKKARVSSLGTLRPPEPHESSRPVCAKKKPPDNLTANTPQNNTQSFTCEAHALSLRSRSYNMHRHGWHAPQRPRGGQLLGPRNMTTRLFPNMAPPRPPRMQCCSGKVAPRLYT